VSRLTLGRAVSVHGDGHRGLLCSADGQRAGALLGALFPLDGDAVCVAAHRGGQFHRLPGGQDRGNGAAVGPDAEGDSVRRGALLGEVLVARRLRHAVVGCRRRVGLRERRLHGRGRLTLLRLAHAGVACAQRGQHHRCGEQPAGVPQCHGRLIPRAGGAQTRVTWAR